MSLPARRARFLALLLLATFVCFSLVACQTEVEKAMEGAQKLHKDGQLEEAIDSLAPHRLDGLVEEPSEKDREYRAMADELRGQWLLERARQLRSEGDILAGNNLLQQKRADYGEDDELSERAITWLLEDSKTSDDSELRSDILAKAREWHPGDVRVLAASAEDALHFKNWRRLRRHLSEFEDGVSGHSDTELVARLNKTVDPLKKSLEVHTAYEKLKEDIEDATNRIERAKKLVETDDDECVEPDAIRAAFELVEAIRPRQEMSAIGIQEVPVYAAAVEFVDSLEQERRTLADCQTKKHRESRAKGRKTYAELILAEKLVGVEGIIKVSAAGRYNDKLVLKRVGRTTYTWAQTFNAVAERPGAMYSELKVLGFRSVWIANAYGQEARLTSLRPKIDEREHGNEVLEEHDLTEPLQLKYGSLYLIGADADEPKGDLTILKAICDRGGAGENGCKRCPSYTFSKGQRERFRPVTSRMVNLSGDDATEVAITMKGCEHHTASYLGTVMLRKEQGGWKRIYYGSGVNLDRCFKVSLPNDREGVACTSEEMAQGHVTSSVYVIMGEGEDVKFNALATFRDNTNACPSGTVESETVQQVESVVDQDGDDPVVAVDVASIGLELPDEYRDLCDAQDDGFSLPEATVRREFYSWTGDEFKTVDIAETPDPD